MRKWGYWLGAVYTALHFSTVLMQHIGHLSREESTRTELKRIPGSLEALWQSVLMRYYAQSAGLHGGYGFYSPHVGSSYHSLFILRSAHGEDTCATPQLTRSATQIRYRSLLEPIDGVIDEQGTLKKLPKALLLSLCRHQSKAHPRQHVGCHYLALSVPTLQILSRHQQAQPFYILLDQYGDPPS